MAWARARPRSEVRDGRKRAMSSPHSAIRTCAAWDWTPGIVHSSSTTCWCGASASSIRSFRFSTAPSSASMWVSSWADHDAVMLDLEAAGERLAQLRDLRAHPGLRELGELLGVGDAGEQGLEHRPGGLRVGVRRDGGELDAGVLEHLLEPLDRAGALVDLSLAKPGQITQPADLRRRHEGRTDPGQNRSKTSSTRACRPSCPPTPTSAKAHAPAAAAGSTTSCAAS